MLGYHPISAMPISALAWIYVLGNAFRVIDMSSAAFDAAEDSGAKYEAVDLSEGIA